MAAVCTVADCGQPSRKRGWCGSHYSQWYRTGEAPQPFRYKWAATGSACVVCGKAAPAGSRRRKHCSAACQQLDSRHRGGRPTTATCILCGHEFSLNRRTTSGRLQRTDTRWCSDCDRESPDAMRFKRYGITPERYVELTANGCAICGAADRKMHVDHDHACCPAGTYRTCGECVRGVLCGQCNQAIGLLNDDPARLASAVAYLAAPRSRT